VEPPPAGVGGSLYERDLPRIPHSSPAGDSNSQGLIADVCNASTILHQIFGFELATS